MASLNTDRTAGIDSSAKRSRIWVNCPSKTETPRWNVVELGSIWELKLSVSTFKSLSIIGLSGDFGMRDSGATSPLPLSKSSSSSPNVKLPARFNSARQLTGNTIMLPGGSPRV